MKHPWNTFRKVLHTKLNKLIKHTDEGNYEFFHVSDYHFNHWSPDSTIMAGQDVKTISTKINNSALIYKHLRTTSNQYLWTKPSLVQHKTWCWHRPSFCCKFYYLNKCKHWLQVSTSVIKLPANIALLLPNIYIEYL